MPETILIAAAAFAATNIDDLLINMFFFADAASPSDARRLTVGKYLGMGTLTALSLLSALGLQLIHSRYLSFLGFVPIVLAIRSVIQSLRKTDEDDLPSNSTRALWLSMMLITIANGADNLGVYIPLFTTFTAWQMATAVCVFAILTGLSCLLASRLSRTAILQQLLNRYRPLIIPIVYILLGLYILL